MDYEKEYNKLLEDYRFLLKKHSELQDEHIENLKHYIEIANILLPFLNSYTESEKFFKKYIEFSSFAIIFISIIGIYYLILLLLF